MTRTIVTIAFCVKKKKLIIQCVSATVSLEHITEQRLQSCAHHLAQSFNHSLSLSEKKKESEQICKFQVNLKTVIEHYLETMRVLRRHWQATEGTVRDRLSARGSRGTGRPPNRLVRAGRPGRPCAEAAGNLPRLRVSTPSRICRFVIRHLH